MGPSYLLGSKSRISWSQCPVPLPLRWPSRPARVPLNGRAHLNHSHTGGWSVSYTEARRKAVPSGSHGQGSQDSCPQDLPSRLPQGGSQGPSLSLSSLHQIPEGFRLNGPQQVVQDTWK